MKGAADGRWLVESVLASHSPLSLGLFKLGWGIQLDGCYPVLSVIEFLNYSNFIIHPKMEDKSWDQFIQTKCVPLTGTFKSLYILPSSVLIGGGSLGFGFTTFLMTFL